MSFLRPLPCLLAGAACITAAAAELPPVPAHQSHTVGWQRTLVICTPMALKGDLSLHGKPVPKSYLDAKAGHETAINQMLATLTGNRTGLRVEFYPKVVGNINKSSGSHSGGMDIGDVLNLDKNFNSRQYDRIWFDTGETGAGQAYVGGNTLWIGYTTCWGGGSRHELMHSFGVGHPATFAGGDGTQNPGPIDHIRFKWLTETDPNGYRFSDVKGSGVYRLHTFHGKLGGEYNLFRPVAAPGADRALRINGSPIVLGLKSVGSVNRGLFFDRQESGKTGGNIIGNVAPAGTWHDKNVLQKGESYTLRLWGNDSSNTRPDRVRVTVVDVNWGKGDYYQTAADIGWCDVKIEFLDGEPLSVAITAPANASRVAAGSSLALAARCRASPCR